MAKRTHQKSGKEFDWKRRKNPGLFERYDPKLKNNVYTIDYYLPNGKRKREKIGTSKRDALDVLAKRRTQIRDGKFFELERENKISFKDLSEKFLTEYSRPPKKAISSVKRDRLSLKHLNRFFGTKMLHQISREAIEDYQNKRLDSGVSNATVNREVACLKCMFNKAVDWKLIKENLASKIKMLRESPGIVRYLTDEERLNLLEACKISKADYLYPLVFTALNTGMRLDELLKLTWRDIDFKNGFIHVENAKGEKRRDLPLIPELTDLLKFSIKKPNTEYVFCDDNGKPYSNINRAWNTAKRRAGIKNFRFHDCRHHFASYLVMRGVDLYTVSELLGHSSIEVTERYAHLSPGYKKKAVLEALSGVTAHNRHIMDTLKAVA